MNFAGFFCLIIASRNFFLSLVDCFLCLGSLSFLHGSNQWIRCGWTTPSSRTSTFAIRKIATFTARFLADFWCATPLNWRGPMHIYTGNTRSKCFQRKTAWLYVMHAVVDCSVFFLPRCYSGSRPITLTVDDIKFRRPVDIGSLLLMSARVNSREMSIFTLCIVSIYQLSMVVLKFSFFSLINQYFCISLMRPVYKIDDWRIFPCPPPPPQSLAARNSELFFHFYKLETLVLVLKLEILQIWILQVKVPY